MRCLALIAGSLMVAAPGAASVESSAACIECHRAQTPGLVRPWAESAHAEAKIGCTGCHDSDVELCRQNLAARTTVSAEVCARCHSKAARSHSAGKHGVAGRTGTACTRSEPPSAEQAATCAKCHEAGSARPRENVGCARFLAQSPAMRRRGCLGCHRIEERCDTCHTAHGTDLAVAADPNTCGRCHMGPDHPQHEMWTSSVHGVLHAHEGEQRSPSCVGCHMVDGTHDVSRGITMGLAGQAYPPEVRQVERDHMLGVCAQCHARSFAARNLTDGDTIQKESKALLDEARAIVEALEREGLLQPKPTERPPHPLSGATLELGPHMLYEDLSRAEAIYFRMKKYHYVVSYKGVFHQNADYAHWLGNAPLKLGLSELRSEAELLRTVARLRQRVDLLSRDVGDASSPATSEVRRDLIRLREQLLEGRMTPEAFDAKRRKMLDGHGL